MHTKLTSVSGFVELRVFYCENFWITHLLGEVLESSYGTQADCEPCQL